MLNTYNGIQKERVPQFGKTSLFEVNLKGKEPRKTVPFTLLLRTKYSPEEMVFPVILSAHPA